MNDSAALMQAYEYLLHRRAAIRTADPGNRRAMLDGKRLATAANVCLYEATRNGRLDTTEKAKQKEVK